MAYYVTRDFQHGADHRGRQVPRQALHEGFSCGALICHHLTGDLRTRGSSSASILDVNRVMTAWRSGPCLGGSIPKQLMARHFEDIRGQVIDFMTAGLGRKCPEVPRHRHHVGMLAEYPVAVF
ncbi:MAG: hypothetical protein R3E50_00895 [Halioglobus sp.]